MKQNCPSVGPGLVLPLAVAACLATMAAQAPQSASDAPPAPQAFPAPTNLKVLPKEMTGQQVHDLMEQWKAGIGMGCAACHVEDKQNLDQDGRPTLNFASDSKPEKAVARLMYAMTEEINTKYIAKIDSSGAPVTCGTCHQGHMGPDPFSAMPNADLRPPGTQQPTGAEQPPQ